jgi:hypothetical protein
MTIEDILSKDFSALVGRFNADDFVERLTKRLNGADRLRLVLVGAAGAAGAAVAASQFGALTNALAGAVPALAAITVADTTLSFQSGPALTAALLFAAIGAATAMVMPGAR